MGIIKDYQAPVKVNPYAADVAELVKLGDGAAYELIAPTAQAEAGKRGRTFSGEKAKFQDAVREAGKSARIAELDEREDGNTRGVFVIGPKRNRTVPGKTSSK